MIYGLLKNEIEQCDYMNSNNITILYDYMPYYICGYTFEYRDIKIIVLNSSYNIEQLRDVLVHELSHIELCHNYDKPRLIKEKEVEIFMNNLYNSL